MNLHCVIPRANFNEEKQYWLPSALWRGGLSQFEQKTVGQLFYVFVQHI